VRLCLRQGWLDQTRQTANALKAAMPEQLPAPMGSFLETWASYCSVRARLDIALGRPDQAAALLDALRDKLAAAGMKYLEAATSLLLALALEQGGARQAARASLARALRYAQTNGMINSFVNEGEPVRALLLGCRHDGLELTGIDAAFLDRLLAAFDDGAAPLAAAGAGAAPKTSDVLTAREIEILGHISRGLSNKEIGRSLRVAPETIKWHLKNIFEKLNVGSRIEAVESGLGLSRAARVGASDAGPRVH
jgi:LuxR family maltose regulon positive regulatory protein